MHARLREPGPVGLSPADAEKGTARARGGGACHAAGLCRATAKCWCLPDVMMVVQKPEVDNYGELCKARGPDTGGKRSGRRVCGFCLLGSTELTVGRAGDFSDAGRGWRVQAVLFAGSSIRHCCTLRGMVGCGEPAVHTGAIQSCCATPPGVNFGAAATGGFTCVCKC